MSYALVILCGGNSSRMGSDKALLPFGDCCLIEYLVRKFSPHFPKIYLSVKKKGDYSHLKLPVTEIPDIHPNAGPMSGVFSALSMMDEDKAFVMSVDTPFMEPETGLALLEAMEDSDICMFGSQVKVVEQTESVQEEDSESIKDLIENFTKNNSENTTNLENPTAAYSKNCIRAIGRCLLLHQFTFEKLQEKCETKYLLETSLPEYASVPMNDQFYNLDTRSDYYQALHILKVLD